MRKLIVTTALFAAILIVISGASASMGAAEEYIYNSAGEVVGKAIAKTAANDTLVITVQLKNADPDTEYIVGGGAGPGIPPVIAEVTTNGQGNANVQLKMDTSGVPEPAEMIWLGVMVFLPGDVLVYTTPLIPLWLVPVK